MTKEKKMPPRALLKKASDGDAESQYALGAMYGAGDFVARDDVGSAQWYLKAAEQGHAEAQRNLGLMFLFGEGLPKDFVIGMSWIEKAAHGGSPDAMRALSDSFRKGLYGYPVNFELADQWAELAKNKRG